MIANRQVVVTLLAGCLSAGCAHNPTAGKDSPAAITDAMRKYNISPIFPFRQDVWMGDVFATTLDYKEWRKKVISGEPVPTNVRVRRLDLSQDLVDFQRSSPRFESTNEDLQEHRVFAWRGKTFRLNPVAAPSFGAFTKKDVSGGLGGSILIASGWLRAFYKKEAKYTISVPRMLGVELPRSGTQFRAAYESRRDLRRLTSMEGSTLYGLAGCREAFPPIKGISQPCAVIVSVVVDVFMAREIAIDVTSASSLDFGGEVEAQATAAHLLSSVTGQLQSTLRDSRSETMSAVDGALKASGATPKLTTKIRSTLDQSLRQSETATKSVLDTAKKPISGIASAIPLPGLGQLGGRVSAASASGKSASLLIALDEPVTIGYRGFAVQYLIDERGRQLGKPNVVDSNDAGPAMPLGALDIDVSGTAPQSADGFTDITGSEPALASAEPAEY